jgi:hypothetical protein
MMMEPASLGTLQLTRKTLAGADLPGSGETSREAGDLRGSLWFSLNPCWLHVKTRLHPPSLSCWSLSLLPALSLVLHGNPCLHLKFLLCVPSTAPSLSLWSSLGLFFLPWFCHLKPSGPPGSCHLKSEPPALPRES